MRRLLIAATTAFALVVAPAAAFAQEPPEEASGSPLDALAELVTQWTDQLFLSRDAVEDASEEDAEAAEADHDTFVDRLEQAVTDVFAALMFGDLASEEQEEAEGEDGANGEAVSTVAQCSPRGSFKALIEGMANHGEYVTAAAHGETVELFVPTVEGDPATGDVTVTPGEEATAFDLTTVEGAEDLCAALDVVYQVRLLELELGWEDVDTAKDARVLAREQCKLERLRARNGSTDTDPNEVCAELRQRVRDQLDQDRAERAAEREERKAERAAEREARKAEQPGQGAGNGNGKGNGKGGAARG